MVTPPGSSIRWPRRSLSATSIRPVRLDADGARGGQRGGGVQAHVGASRTASSRSPRSSSGAEASTTVTSSRRCGSSSGSPRGTTAVPPGFRPRDERRLLGGDRLERAQLLEVDRADVRDAAPTSGSAIARELGDLARRRASPSRARAPRCPAGAPRTVSGSPISVLRFACVATVASLLADHRGEEVLRRGLAGRAGDADDLRAELPAPRGRERAAARRAGRRPRARRRRPSAARRARARRARPTRPARAPARRTRPPSTFSPRRPTKRSPGPASRESMTARDGPVARRRARDEPRARRPRRPAQASTRARRSASRATVTSSNGTLRAVRELLALLVALAGDDDDVAGARPADRALDRLAAVDVPLGAVAHRRRGSRG